MPELIALLQHFFKNRKAEAAYLGYSTKGYYNIRQLIERGESLPPRTEDHIRLKASLLPLHYKESHCDCSYKSSSRQK